jgi:hypothetical protein
MSMFWRAFDALYDQLTRVRERATVQRWSADSRLALDAKSVLARTYTPFDQDSDFFNGRFPKDHIPAPSVYAEVRTL